MSESTFNRVRALLDARGIAYQVVEHSETLRSAASADARGLPLAAGAKALLLKAGDRFVLAVLRANRKLDSRAVQRLLGVRKLRFATREELAAHTGGLIPGAVPPFGRPVLPFELLVDASIAEGAEVAFNAGLLTRSVILATNDYLTLTARPVCHISGRSEGQ
ncbi:MAG TPA: YbaK/EbsC family protein [Thermoanaerobaculia bacterium]|nr:YbaK/EbsC family protein [Thermoanaerobaculia bacterium]